MRKYAILKSPINNIKKVMIYECDEGVYAFPFDTIDDAPAIGDDWFDTLEDAEEICKHKYMVKDEEWISISDPIEYCQHDIIAPVRIKGRNLGRPEWGVYEKLIDGKWYEVKL